jgi:Ca2+/H+ antiporter, TMEM165/GDT1 family
VLGLYFPALVAAFLIVIVEMTEVVALVFALSADHASVRPGAAGAVAGSATIGVIALASGALLLELPRSWLLWGSAVALAAFGVFLFRSTLRSYRRSRASTKPGSPQREGLLFAGGFSVGAVESTEAVIVLLAIDAAGYGREALVGAVIAGAVLVAAAVIVHDRIRKIKVPLLKLGATSLLFAFAVFWGGEATGYSWPGQDLSLIPLFLAGLVVVRGGVWAFEKQPMPVQTKG